MQRVSGSSQALAVGVVSASVAALTPTVAAAQPSVEAAPLAEIEIVEIAVLPGLGLPRDWVPANVRTFSAQEMSAAQSSNLMELLVRQAGFGVNEVQGNTFQPELTFRGFVASPVLGTPQGLSVFIDGVRANEPFGDTVNWDLIPEGALATMELLPGSNPVFGLNTMGGALSLRTKSGLQWQGTGMELAAGSFGQRRVAAEHGGRQGSLGWFLAADRDVEQGWRDYSPSRAERVFGKLSLAQGATEWSLALTGANTSLAGNGLLPLSMLLQRRSQVFTHPDITRNRLVQGVMQGLMALDEHSSLALVLYHRALKSTSLNGDANGDFFDSSAQGVSQAGSGVYNRTYTQQHGAGGSLQWNGTLEGGHRLAVGAAMDLARTQFQQTAEQGVLDETRGVSELEAPVTENALEGRTQTAGVYGSGTFLLAPTLQLTASARYYRSRVQTEDRLVLTPPNLDGDHRYTGLNPALGLTWQVTPQLTGYAALSQGTRVPTPIELGCADPFNPCTLPNSMAADPYLRQVVARSIEMGMRGHLANEVRWNLTLFRADNRNDILFVGTATSAGYFKNFGATRREGLEFAASGQWQSVDWQWQYSHLRAQFQSTACLLAPHNSTRGTDVNCTASQQDDEIFVRRGDKLPGLPRHQFRLALGWQMVPWLKFSASLQVVSSAYARGNENNAHQAGLFTDRFGTQRYFSGAGTVPGYALAGVLAEANLGATWRLSLRVNNLLGRRYATAAALAENPFDGQGAFQMESANWSRETFVGPGAPRAVWLGVRYGLDP